MLNLGLIQSLAAGLVSPTEAVRVFYHAANCQTVRTKLKDKTADRVMSHGTQLPDLFEALPAEEANREFRQELETMRILCENMLAGGRLAA